MTNSADSGQSGTVRPGRWLWLVVAAGLVASVVAWRVADGDEESRQYAGEQMRLDGVVPARAGITLPPGSPIGSGFEVAEGSYLLAGAMPYLYSTMHGGDPIEDDGLQAWLLVTEPIRTVVDRYLSQAMAAGFEMTPVDCMDGEGVLRCSTSCAVDCGFPYEEEPRYEHGRTLLISGVQGRARPDQPPMSHLDIDYRRIGDPPYPGEDGYLPPDDPPSTPVGTVPEDWPPLPDVGEPIYSFNDFEVAPGTVLLAHGLNAFSGSGEAIAIFEVVEDVDTVIDDFAAQPRFPAENLTRETLTRDGHRYDHVYWSDGQSQSLEFHDPPNGPTILVLRSYIAD